MSQGMRTAETNQEGGASVPRDFSRVLDALKRALVRPELSLEEIPAPKRLAPYAVALSATVADPETRAEMATGRFILLHAPEGDKLWGGKLRIVTYIRAEVDGEMGNDQLVASVAWTWLVEALEEHQAPYRRAGGTATRVLSENFGDMVGRPEHVDIELRASWTPEGTDVQSQLEAWCDMVCSFAGLPPLAEGVVPMPRVRLT